MDASQRKRLTKMEIATLVESLCHQLHDHDLDQVDDILKIVKTRIALKTHEDRKQELEAVIG